MTHDPAYNQDIWGMQMFFYIFHENKLDVLIIRLK